MTSGVFEGLPSAVRIGWTDYAVELASTRELDHAKTYGSAQHGERIIRLNPDMDGRNAANTLLHEILHAVGYVGGLEKGDEDERVVNVTANMLTQVWRDNPVLIAWLDRHLKD